MQTRELEIFLTLADLLHFGRASQICNLSASALTRTIQRLEEQVGQPLFIRNKRQVSLTATGQKFRIYARQTVQDWQRFQATLRSEQPIAGTLSIYASITAVYSLLPNLLESYRNAYPKVQLELRTGTADQAVAQVQTGEIDLAVAALPDHNRSKIEFLPITTTPLVFIAPLLAKDSNSLNLESLSDLSNIPLVLPQAGLARRRLEKWLRSQHILPKIGSEVSGNEAIIPMVRLGCGVGIVPQLVLERSPFRDEVQVLKNAPQLEPYVVGLCSTKRNLQGSSVQAFWSLAEAQSPQKIA